MAHSNLRSDVIMRSPSSSEDHPFGSNTLDDFTPDILDIPNDDLLNEVSQISEQYKPVSKRKGMRSYACGTSGTSSGSEYEPSKDSENKTDKEKSRDNNQPKKKRKKLTLRKR